MPVSIDDIRHTRPTDAEHLKLWIKAFTGVQVASEHVCRNHQPPLDWLGNQWLNRPPLILILGARGSGKSFLQAVLTHLESRFSPRLGTRILGGSKAQSSQIYEALCRSVRDGKGNLGSDADTLRKLLKTEAVYRNGSNVSILAASSTSVRGPHVPSLRLDEVDEIDPEIRDASLGMAMQIGDIPATVSMTSTWHRVGGPMTELMERARNGEFPHYTTCTFDVLERCPESRSGVFVGGDSVYERCPDCPIRRWCHSERDRNGDRPLAKLSNGHYAIDSLILHAKGNSLRSFESDFLCRGPRSEGLWFTGFDDKNISEDAEYDPKLKVHCSIDSGVFTGAVWFQVRERNGQFEVTVFQDYLTEGLTAERNAIAILSATGTRCGQSQARYSTDPAGGSRNPVGPTVIAEFDRAGLKPLGRWPLHRTVADGLALVESLIRAADGSVGLTIHPRCKHLISGLQNYRRAKRGGQWMDYPQDPDHPFEDIVDALRGGMNVEFPEGRRPKPKLLGIPAGHLRS